MVNPPEPIPEETSDGAPRAATSGSSRPDGEPGTTVGTGSVLGIGCVVAVVILVVIAVVLRWLTGTW